MRSAIRLAALLASAFVPSIAAGQGVPVKRLGQPSATHPAEFTRIQGVRELGDGRAFLVDAHEFRVVRIDFRSGAVEELGRQGRGPGEYTAPLGLLALPGDSAVVVDMSGNPTSVLLTPSGVSTDGLAVEGSAPGRTAVTHRSASDARGRIHFPTSLIRTVDGKPMPTDSTAIVRIDRASGRRDTVAFVSNRARSPLIKAEPERQVIAGMAVSRPMSSPIPFMSVDQFAVAPDGRVAVVSVDPYRVTFTGADGRRTEGPVIAFTPVRVDEAVKEGYRVDVQRPRPGILLSRDGSTSARVTPGRLVEPKEWPATLPAFLADAVAFASDGTLWVKRATRPDAPPTFDLIDGAGRVTSQVELPQGRRLVGFGNGTVYLVRVDEDGLEYVERYGLPR